MPAKNPGMRNSWTLALSPTGLALSAIVVIAASSLQAFPLLAAQAQSTLPMLAKATSDNRGKRAVTAADVIEMSVLEPPTVEGTHFAELSVQFSPDRSRFVVIVRKGNLKTDAVDYSLL